MIHESDATVPSNVHMTRREFNAWQRLLKQHGHDEGRVTVFTSGDYRYEGWCDVYEIYCHITCTVIATGETVWWAEY